MPYVRAEGWALGGIRLSPDAGICAPGDLVRCCSQHLRMPAESAGYRITSRRKEISPALTDIPRQGFALAGISIVLSTG
jgi:hypothetical protein